MGTISVSLPSDGTTADVSDYNTPLTTITNAINGNLDNANIASGAAIATSKLADDAGITNAKIASGALYTSKVYNPYKFSVYRNAAFTIPGNTTTLIQFDAREFDTGSNVDITTNKGRFTAPVAGFYQFEAAVFGNTNGSGNNSTLLYKNGSSFKQGQQTYVGTATGTVPVVSALMQLSANDYVEVYSFFQGGGTVTITTGAITTYFCGFLVSAT